MCMHEIDTDYLIVGAGALGLAFADSLLEYGDGHITFVDQHAKPGGALECRLSICDTASA